MDRAFGAGVHSLAWKRQPGGFSARAALFYLWNQLEQGTACPVTMTFASVAMLDQAPEIARDVGSRRCSPTPTIPRPVPVGAEGRAPRSAWR